MKREIKFRGKKVQMRGSMDTSEAGEFVFGSYVSDGYEHFIITDENIEWCVDPETVGQYTGLPDEDGTDIYEKTRFQHEDDIGTVVFRNGMYCVEWDAPHTWGKDTLLWKIHDGGQVVIDNPDL